MGEFIEMEHTVPEQKANNLFESIKHKLDDILAEQKKINKELDERRKEKKAIYQEVYRKEENVRLVEKAKRDAEAKYAPKAPGEAGLNIGDINIKFNPNGSIMGKSSDLDILENARKTKLQ